MNNLNEDIQQYCPQCGTRVLEEYKFCRQCGKDLLNQTKAVNPDQENIDTKKFYTEERILSEIKRYNKQTQVTCLECGYNGLAGICYEDKPSNLKVFLIIALSVFV